MNPPQLEITEAGLLTGPFSCVLNMPTGSGKTWLAEQAIRATVEAGGVNAPGADHRPDSTGQRTLAFQVDDVGLHSWPLSRK